MKLSLSDAARLLGRSERQIRYLIKTGKLEATQVAGRWVIDSEKLPRSEAQARAAAQKAVDLAQAVSTALAPTQRARKAFSVRSLATFTEGESLWRRTAELGENHAARGDLEGAMVALATGYHRYHQREKVAAYRDARELARVACLALDLHVASSATTPRPDAPTPRLRGRIACLGNRITRGSVRLG